MALPSIEEKDQYPVRVTIKDADAVPVSPSTLRYKVDCITTQTAVIPWTYIAALSQVDIVIPSSANAIVNNRNAKETKRITVQANSDSESQINKRYDYNVINNMAYA